MLAKLGYDAEMLDIGAYSNETDDILMPQLSTKV